MAWSLEVLAYYIMMYERMKRELIEAGGERTTCKGQKEHCCVAMSEEHNYNSHDSDIPDTPLWKTNHRDRGLVDCLFIPEGGEGSGR